MARTQDSVETQLRAGALHLPEVLMQAIAVVGPAFGILFSLQFISSLAGVTAPVAFFLGLALMFLVAIPLAQLAKHLVSAGGYYTYVSRGVGPRIGFLTAWLFVLYEPLAPAFVLGFAGLILQNALKENYGITFPWWAFLIICVLIIAALSYRGVRLAGRTLLVTGGIELLIFMLLGLWGLLNPGHGGFNFSSFNPGNSISSHGLYLGVVFSILAFLGWEAAAPLAEETVNPRRNIPWSIIGSLSLMGVFFLFCTWGIIVGWGTLNIGTLISSTDNPAFVLAKHFWGGFWVVTLVALVNSAFSLSLGNTNVATRMWFAMARSGSLPSSLAKVHSRYQTPVNAITAEATLTIVACLSLGLWLGPDQAFFLYGLVSVFAAVFAYIAGNLGVFRFIRANHPDEFNVIIDVVCPVAGTIGLLWVTYKSLIPLPAAPIKYAPIVFAVWLIAGVAVLMTLRARGKESWLLEAGHAAMKDL